MLMTHFPGMLVSEKTGWEEIDHSHYSARWFFKRLVMSLLPPVLYSYAELVHPGAIFPLSMPLLHITDEKTAHYVANMVTLSSIGAGGSACSWYRR